MPAPADRTVGRRAARPGARPDARLTAGLLVGVTASLTLALLPGSAAATPGDPVTHAATAEEATRLVPDATHEPEVVTEQLNEARETLAQQRAAAEAAEQAVADARVQLDALDEPVRWIARSAFTGENLSRFNALMTSGSTDEFLAQVTTLDTIAGHTDQVLGQVAEAAAAAAQAASTRRPPQPPRSRRWPTPPPARTTSPPGSAITSSSSTGQPREHLHRQGPDGARLDVRSAGARLHGGHEGLRRRPPPARLTAPAVRPAVRARRPGDRRPGTRRPGTRRPGRCGPGRAHRPAA
ncbi:hypothetical protein GCU67_07685 [Modestobacter muralis]|uniref:Uncharacterized protein n=1 Tax=Modestobacter muralis TaxID=1608614 RepID=A0A6P0ETQ3_9ACTN|nr:hypothetical protein [Modestobacter muralis]NEK94056.1 hypothetical protein [Modestobacter muralis]NEN50823.1 hypothetical protein [Modestobacter muralis]